MRVLVVTPTYLPIIGGAEIGVYEIYRRFAGRHDVRILTPNLIGDAIQEDYADGPPVVRFIDRWSIARIRGHRAFGGIAPPFSLTQIGEISRQIREFRPDIINLHYAVPGGLAAVVNQRRLRVPVVLSMVGRDVPGPNTPPVWRYYVRAVARRCAGTVFISDYCRRQVFGDTSPANTRVIPYGASLLKLGGSDKASMRAKLGLPSDAVILLSVQRLAPEKRVDVVLRAMAGLATEGRKVFLAIAGGGPCLDELSQLSDRLGLSSVVRFFGRTSDESLAALYQAADVFVFHSTYETFGVVLVEALAAGLPIVSVDSTAIPELVHDGENGFTVPALDHVAMADRMRTLTDDAGLRARMSETAAGAAAGYDWDRIAEEYEEALNETRSMFLEGMRDHCAPSCT